MQSSFPQTYYYIARRRKQIFSCRGLLNTILMVSVCLLASCLGTKSLVNKQSGARDYDFVGDTINGWSLVRQDSLWGYASQDGKRVITPVFQWANDFTNGMAMVQGKRGYRYINEQGKQLRRVRATHAYPFSEGLASVEIRGKWSYINLKGKKVIKRHFDWAQPFSENRAAVSIGLKKGYINKKGELVIPAIYEEAHPFKNGVAIVRKDMRFGIIDTLGDFLLPNQYAEIEAWETNFYRLGVYTPATDRVSIFGLADAAGKLLLDTVYSAIDLLKKEYVRAKRGTWVGLFDRNGKVIIPMEYTSLGFISQEGLIAAQKNEQWGFLNTDGKVMHPFEYEGGKMGFSEGRSWVYKDSTYLLIDNHFNVINKFPEYNNVFYFSNGFAIVGKKDTSSYHGGDVYGFIDKNGNEVIAPQYHAAWPINPYGTTVVGIHKEGITKEFIINTKGKLLSEEKYYFSLQSLGDQLLYNSYGVFLSSKTGQPLTEFPYEKMYPVEYGERKDWAKVYREGKAGLIDTTITELLPPEYEAIGDYHIGRMKVKKDGHWGYADERFRIRIPMVYDDASYFRYPLTEVAKGKKKGIIDRSGRTIIPLNYIQISFDFACDRIYAEKKDSIDIYDREGRLLLASDFSYIGLYGRNNYVAYRQGGKLGFMDYDFNVLYEPTFDACGHFYDGLAWVSKDQKGGFINEQFQLVIPVQFDDIESFANGFTKVKKEGREYYINTEGEELMPTEAQLHERDEEVERRKRGWIDFSS